MFTGIIKEVGRVQKLIKASGLTKLGISSKLIYQDTIISNSVACNGVCLTLINKERELLFFDAVKPTLDKTNLKFLKIGDYINLETSLKLQDKLGGHFVLGHIDTEAKLKKVIKKSQYWQLEIELPLVFRKFIVENGSIAIEGISLTVKKIMPHSFTVDIIPFTYANTNLKYKRIGDRLNLEFDCLLKKQT
jgi:riboflavin synthase